MRARKAADFTRFWQVSEQKRRLAFLLTSMNTRPRTFVTINTLYTSHALRAAQADDVEAIASIWHDGWRDGHLGHVPDDVLPHRTLHAWLAVVAGNSPRPPLLRAPWLGLPREFDNAADDAVIPALRYEKSLSPATLKEAPT